MRTISQETISADWWRVWRDHAEVILAELLEIPAAYIVLDFELPKLRVDTDVAGCALLGVADHLRGDLEPRWHGNGPAMVIVTNALERSIGGFVDDLPGVLASMAWGIAAHEIGHWLEWAEFEEICPHHSLAEIISIDAVAFDALVSFDDRQSDAQYAANHGSQFCWNTLHVVFRLQDRGIDASAVTALNFEAMGLPRPAYILRSAICAELVAGLTRPLTELAMCEIPPGFLDLFDLRERGSLIMSNVTTFFADLKASEASVLDTTREQWEALVIAVANGNIPEAADVRATLESLGRTADDLQRVVQRILDRRRLVAKITAADEAQGELPDLQRRIAESARELALVEQEHRATIAPLQRRQVEIAELDIAAERARENLERLAKDSGAAKRIRERDAEIERLGHMLRNLSSELDDLRSEFARRTPSQGGRSEADRSVGGGISAPRHPADLADDQRRATDLQERLIPAKVAEWKQAKAEIKRLTAECDADRALMLSADLID